MTVRFIGYVEYMPGHFHAEFVVEGDSRLPDGSQVSWDTLNGLGIKTDPFPNYWEYTRERFIRLLRLRKMLKGEIHAKRNPERSGETDRS